MMSLTYAGSFYTCAKKGSKNKEKTYHILSNLRRRLDLMRENSKYAGRLFAYNSYEKKYGFDLSQMKGFKIGNCAEYSKATLAALCANGYYNSSRAGLLYEIKFINKKTKKVEYREFEDLDHNFVITDLNKRKKKDIVIDSWLGFADYECGAFAKFRQIYDDELDTYEEMHKKLFRIEKMKNGEEFNPEDYEMRTGFQFRDSEYLATPSDKEKLGKLVAQKHPGLLLDVNA